MTATPDAPPDLSQAIATAAARQGHATAHDLVESMRGEFVKALPQHITVDHFMRLALTELRQSPELAEASADSLLGALMTAARLGLEPGGPLGHYYLTPRTLKGRGKVVVPIVGYRGLLELARRSGQVGAIDADIVREGDYFERGYDSRKGGPFTVWTPKDYDDTRRPIGVLAYAELIGAARPAERFLPIEKVHERRDRGAAGNRGPWATDEEAMIRKTGLRYLAPVLPQSTMFALATRIDEQVQTYRPGVDIAEGGA